MIVVATPLPYLLQCLLPSTVSNNNIESNGNDSADSSNRLGSGEIAGIAVGVVAAFIIAVFATYKVAYAQGAKDTFVSYENEKETNKDGPQMVNEAID